MPEFSRLKSEGRVVDAVIVAKQTELKASTQRRQAGSSENFFFVLRFDPAAGIPFGSATASEQAAPATIAKPKSGVDIVAALDIGGTPAAQGSGTQIQTRVNAGSFERFERHRAGETISITYLPGEPAATRLTETVRAFNSLPLIALALALLLGGVVSALAGWKKRVAEMRARTDVGAAQAH
jgi:hypothetical protein